MSKMIIVERTVAKIYAEMNIYEDDFSVWYNNSDVWRAREHTHSSRLVLFIYRTWNDGIQFNKMFMLALFPSYTWCLTFFMQGA